MFWLLRWCIIQVEMSKLFGGFLCQFHKRRARFAKRTAPESCWYRANDSVATVMPPLTIPLRVSFYENRGSHFRSRAAPRRATARNISILRFPIK